MGLTAITTSGSCVGGGAHACALRIARLESEASAIAHHVLFIDLCETRKRQLI